METVASVINPVRFLVEPWSRPRERKQGHADRQTTDRHTPQTSSGGMQDRKVHVVYRLASYALSSHQKSKCRRRF